MGTDPKKIIKTRVKKLTILPFKLDNPNKGTKRSFMLYVKDI